MLSLNHIAWGGFWQSIPQFFYCSMPEMWSPRATSQPIPAPWHSWWLLENGWPQRRLLHTLPDGFPIISLSLQAPGDQVWDKGTSPIHANAYSHWFQLGSPEIEGISRCPAGGSQFQSSKYRYESWKSKTAQHVETNGQMVEDVPQ